MNSSDLPKLATETARAMFPHVLDRAKRDAAEELFLALIFAIEQQAKRIVSGGPPQ